ncbi:DNAj [Anaeramoeba flamelloides]|uniref:DNAj n=1 Tax=Anaeramoeba flamelloides TaxID=1746091 RepID=A0AAV7Y661_9EUKA|nr:DNAj [Anaeramoeba flamelloides]
MDHYQRLNVSRSATKPEIKRAYKKIALLCHPDKVSEDKKSQAIEIFSSVNEAYHVLSDPELRRVYDQDLMFQKTNTQLERGLMGLKKKKKKKEKKKNNKNNSKIKIQNENFTTTTTTTTRIKIPLSRCKTLNTNTPILKKTKPILRKHNTYHFKKSKLKPTRKVFLFTLEQAYYGSSQIIDFERIYYDQKNSIVKKKQSKIRFLIPKGARDGQEFAIERKGNKKVNYQTADLIITIKAIKHNTFTRNGDDLFFIKKISLVESLTFFNFKIQLLNKKMLKLKFGYDESVVKPGKQLVLNGIGMPKFNNSEQFGDLIIAFEIRFPVTLTLRQKEMLLNTFSEEEKN